MSCPNTLTPRSQCALGLLIVPLTVLNSSEITKWHTHSTFSLCQETPSEGFQRFPRIIQTTWGDGAIEKITQYLSATIADTANVTARALSAQKDFLNLLAHVMLDKRFSLDYLLAELGGICVILNNTCCTWINASGIVETQIKILTKEDQLTSF